MRKLHRYLTVDYLVIFVAALGLITFVMTVGALVKAVDLMARGISPPLILKFFFQNIPYIMSFSMPISTLFAALLLFGRLSMDNEISAMKACGISLWRLVTPLVVLSVLFSAICIYINCEVAPAAKYANRALLQGAGIEEPINLLEEGRFINDFPGLMIYVGHKDGNEMKDVVAYEPNDEGGIIRSVRAKDGILQPDNEKRQLAVQLYNVHIEIPDAIDPHDVSKTTYVNAEHYPIILNFDDMMSGGRIRLKRSYMTMGLLIDLVRYADRISDITSEQQELEAQSLNQLVMGLEGAVQQGELGAEKPLTAAEGRKMLIRLPAEDLLIEKSRMMIEANRRVSIAIGCFTFMLIGIPLGVKSHRKETSVGMVMSLAIVFAYYIFIVVAKALADYPHLHPNLILWIPMVGLQLLGIRLIRRSS